jgi:uncharacterized protein YbjT (DUF2867 family)
MPNPPILVVGATGNVGVGLIQELRHAGHAVRVLARDPRRAAERLGAAVEVVAGDLSDPASLGPALSGVEIASLATSPTPRLAEQEGNLIEEASAAGLRRLVKLSAFGIEFSSDRIHHAHAESERRLRASGLAHVIVRPVVFMSNLLFDLASIRAGNLPSLFGDARMSFVDPSDVAEVMARALLDDRHEGATWEFGGPEELTYDELAATLTRVLRRRVEHVRLDDAAFRAAALASGLPDFVVEAITDAAAHARAGRYATNDALIQRLLGRRGRRFGEWLERHREPFGA